MFEFPLGLIKYHIITYLYILSQKGKGVSEVKVKSFTGRSSGTAVGSLVKVSRLLVVKKQKTKNLPLSPFGGKKWLNKWFPGVPVWLEINPCPFVACHAFSLLFSCLSLIYHKGMKSPKNIF